MLCRQLGWEMSGQLLWLKEGAASSLLLSPVKVKLVWLVEPLDPLLELVLLLALLAELEGRSIIQGTGTSFSPLEPVLEVLDVLEALLELLPALELSERTAKSSRPEVGLTITSLIVPRVLPEESVTCAPVNWLARSS